MKKLADRCLAPKCEGLSHTRGLCPSHYHMARYYVAKGDVTWEGLEAQGKIAPRKRRGRHADPASAWIVGGTDEGSK